MSNNNKLLVNGSVGHTFEWRGLRGANGARARARARARMRMRTPTCVCACVYKILQIITSVYQTKHD